MVDDARRGVPADQVAALTAAALGRLLAGHTRYDVLRLVWTMPWQVGAVLAAGAAAVLGRLVPLVQLGWSLRVVVAGIAVVQAVAAGHPIAAAAICTLLALPHVHPWACARWRRHALDAGDRFVVQHELGQALATHLRSVARDPASRSRADRLDPPVGPVCQPTGPRLALVKP